jgi:hypothetical protein
MQKAKEKERESWPCSRLLLLLLLLLMMTTMILLELLPPPSLLPPTAAPRCSCAVLPADVGVL